MEQAGAISGASGAAGASGASGASGSASEKGLEMQAAGALAAGALGTAAGENSLVHFFAGDAPAEPAAGEPQLKPAPAAQARPIATPTPGKHFSSATQLVHACRDVPQKRPHHTHTHTQI